MKKLIAATILFSLFFWLCFSVSRTFAEEQNLKVDGAYMTADDEAELAALGEEVEEMLGK